MANMLKHIGKLSNTDQKVVVVLMQIPNRPDHALIVPVDGLPDRLEQFLMDQVTSREGQGTDNLYDVLNRRVMPENSALTLLQFLHESASMRAHPVSKILMEPLPNKLMSLETILIELGRLDKAQAQSAADVKHNPYTSNQNADKAENNRGIAMNILAEARDLEAIAASKRTEAYRMCPELAPSSATSVRATAPATKATVSKKPAAKAPAKAATKAPATKKVAAKKDKA